MPKGRKKSHKGGHRHFTNEEQMAANSEKVRKEREWRKQRGMLDSDEEEEEAEAEAKSAEAKSEEGGAAAKPADRPDLPPSDSEESSSDEDEKHKGVSHLIEIENPNRVQKKTKKVTELDGAGGKTELSRREREELEKQQSKERYMKMHMAGKTDEARADLARLAIIRKQREDAAKRKEEEKLVKDAKAKK